jgi:putative addiction module component (TIGR02574 family)
MSAQEIMEAALKLPSVDRERLGEVLLESVDQGWNDLDLSDAELNRRLQEMKTDQNKRVALETVFPELKKSGKN